MKINTVDHLALTVKDIEKSVDFYTDVLGMTKEVYGDNRIALKFGDQKINLQEVNKEYSRVATHVVSGSGDLCFICETPMRLILKKLADKGIKLEDGPILRRGTKGPLNSIYVRDPDGNLIELSNYL